MISAAEQTTSRRSRPAGFTLIEMLTTVAALVIVLGLMVSLARYVRVDSANRVTRDLLYDLDRLMARYANQHNGRLPPVPSFIDVADVLDESALAEAARINNEQVLAYLREDGEALSDEVFDDLPISIYDGQTLRDAWGSPVVFMHRQHPAVGMAPQDRWFFFSAGPDRRFLTREDNLYSYEAARIEAPQDR